MTRRLLIASIGLTVVVLIVLVVPLGLSFADREREDLLAGVERDAVAIAFYVEDELDPEATDVGIDVQAVAEGYQRRTGGRVVVVDGQGISVADSEPPPGSAASGRDFASRPEFATALAGSVSRGTRRSTTLGEGFVFVAVPVASGGLVDGAVRITYPTGAVDSRVRRNWLVLGGLSAVTLATAAVISLVLASSVTRPLRRLQAAADEMGEGDLGARVPVEPGPPEIRDVATTFNRMAGQLQALVGAQEQFVADASHELRTPLTALRLRLEVLQATERPDPADLDAALAEVGRLARLVESLLALARADRLGAEPATPVPLREFLLERRDAWAPLAAESGVELAVEAHGEPAALTGPDRLAQVVDNLLANALEVAPEGSTVRLTATGVPGGQVEVHVIDAGPGLTSEERERAFDRFWRRPGGRGATGGSGIGLAIVRKLVTGDGGDVRLEQAPGGGIDAVARFPAG